MNLTNKIKPKFIIFSIISFISILIFILILTVGTGIKKLPDITLIDLKGNSLSLKSLQGKPTLITFWASNCGTCMKDFPHLVKLYHELSDSGLQMIGIAMPYDLPRAVLEVSQYYSVPYPLALDSNSVATAAFGGVKNTPTTFLFAPDGRVILQTVGAIEISHFKKNIKYLLQQTKKI